MDKSITEGSALRDDIGKSRKLLSTLNRSGKGKDLGVDHMPGDTCRRSMPMYGGAITACIIMHIQKLLLSDCCASCDRQDEAGNASSSAEISPEHNGRDAVLEYGH